MRYVLFFGEGFLILPKKLTNGPASVELSIERADLVWGIKEAIEFYRKTQENTRKSIKFTTSYPKIFANIDSVKVLQVINNLFSNALKFTHENGIIHIHIEKLEKTA
jgi:two-component system sensor histidine kinase VicK